MTMLEAFPAEDGSICTGCGQCVARALATAEEAIAQARESHRLIALTRAETRRWLTWRDSIYRGDAA